jgi:hypothetical protein
MLCCVSEIEIPRSQAKDPSAVLDIPALLRFRIPGHVKRSNSSNCLRAVDLGRHNGRHDLVIGRRAIVDICFRHIFLDQQFDGFGLLLFLQKLVRPSLRLASS